jgi:hypothetical protein
MRYRKACRARGATLELDLEVVYEVAGGYVPATRYDPGDSPYVEVLHVFAGGGKTTAIDIIDALTPDELQALSDSMLEVAEADLREAWYEAQERDYDESRGK